MVKNGHSHGGSKCNDGGGHGGHGHSHAQKEHSNAHGHSHGSKKCFNCSDTARLSSMLCMTFIFFLVELIVGQMTKSIALTTDSFHMLADALSLVIGLLGTVISKRKTTKNTFGWVRAEVLGALVNSVFLLSLCLSMAIEAVERLFEQKQIEDMDLLLYTGLLGLFINLLGMFVFGHAHAHSHNLSHATDEDEDNDEIGFEKHPNQSGRSKETRIYLADGPNEPLVNGDNNPLPLNNETNQKRSTAKKPKKSACCHILSKEANMNMKAVFLHVLADAIGSVIVIISALLNRFKTELKIPNQFINLIDPILCICFVTLIICATFPLLKESALILLQTVPKEIDPKELKDELVKKVIGVSSVHELHIWKLSGEKIIATAHVKCHNPKEYMQIAAQIKEFFHKKKIHSTTIQPEFLDPEEAISHDSCILECLEDCNPNTCCGTNSPNTGKSQTALKNLTQPVNNNNNNNTANNDDSSTTNNQQPQSSTTAIENNEPN